MEYCHCGHPRHRWWKCPTCDCLAESELLSIRDYSAAARSTAVYPASFAKVYPLLGLLGECGEVAAKAYEPVGGQLAQMLVSCAFAGAPFEKLNKRVRDSGALSPSTEAELIAASRFLTASPELLKELGDVLWYLSVLAEDLGSSLEEVAKLNLEKFAKRKAVGALHGSGDER